MIDQEKHSSHIVLLLMDGSRLMIYKRGAARRGTVHGFLYVSDRYALRSQ